jgi:hypothetical protein
MATFWEFSGGRRIREYHDYHGEEYHGDSGFRPTQMRSE